MCSNFDVTVCNMSNFDWNKCLFCQHVLAKCKTVCPADSKRADVGHGYASLAAAVDRFRETRCLPPGLKCKDWDADPAAGEVASCSGEVVNTCDTDTEPAKVARLKRTVQSAENLMAYSTCFFCEKKHVL